MMKQLILVWFLVALGGCTHYLYQGQINAADSDGIDREVVLYWHKTTPLIGDDKAGPASLLTECGSLVSFDEQEQGIVFRGEPGRDIIASTNAPVKNGDICGQFVNAKKFVALGRGELEVEILCVPGETDEFSIVKRNYLGAKNSTYRFDIVESKKWSVFGKSLQAPIRPTCREDQ